MDAALHGGGAATPLAPFFRFPGFESTPATLDLLQSRGIMVFGTDLWASDWNPMTPQQELKILADRLNIEHKGIILLHDPKGHTAAMLPAFLRYLRENHYHVVNLVPAIPGAKESVEAESVKSEGAKSENAKLKAQRPKRFIEPKTMCGSPTINAPFTTRRILTMKAMGMTVLHDR